VMLWAGRRSAYDCLADPSVLHLAASSLTQQAYSFFSVLLRNQHTAVNLQDYESGYTALHRALFAGNLRAARDLLARHDIDLSIKDAEGLTAVDLYNGTVDGVSADRSTLLTSDQPSTGRRRH
jgi:ankyrin repeat protein